MVIEIRPRKGRWEAFEGDGVAPLFADREDAIHYVQERHRTGEIRVLDQLGNVERVIPLIDPAARL